MAIRGTLSGSGRRSVSASSGGADRPSAQPGNSTPEIIWIELHLQLEAIAQGLAVAEARPSHLDEPEAAADQHLPDGWKGIHRDRRQSWNEGKPLEDTYERFMRR
ncbi:hypothetical protein [Bradyrhizobium sp. BR 1432]|uniref:hypothetical protein n=1 Tax=Bradyrhizobium sp. BR 1432 TaxID=3447966 RepID=UPI003EE5895E